MPKVSPLQSNFNGGEFSPFLHGRVDNERYQTGLETCTNFIPTIQGGLTRRSGTYYVAEVKTSSASTRLVAFQFSVTQAYILEFGNTYIRFYKDNDQIESSPGTPYEISTPYLTADLFELKFTQSADVLYIVHPDYAPRKLSRTSDTSWTLTEIDFVNGPYLPNDDRGWTLAPGAATGSTTVTTGPTYAVSNAANNGSGLIRLTIATHAFVTGDRVGVASVGGTTEANGSWTVTVINNTTIDLQGSAFVNAYTAGGTVYPGVFYSTDVGRLIRVLQGTVWGYGEITAFGHAGSVTVSIVDTWTSTAAKSVWRLGVYSATTGYPACVTFHEDRLFFGGSPNAPQRIDGSRTGDYETFSTSDADGTITASHAVSFTLNSNDVNVIRWFSPDEKGLLVGTVGGEWVVRAASINEAISPTNISAKKSTSYGSADIQPVQVGKATLHLQRSTRKLREFLYFYDVDGFRANDLTLIAEHITGEGIVELAYTKEPQSIVWGVRVDGALIGMTYERDLDALRAGWHKHFIGGYGDAANNMAEVESIAVIPSPDATREELWMIVKRYINGSTKRYVEYLTKFFEDTDDQQDAYFVDCGLTYDNPKTITGITKANPAVVTSASHGFSNGDKVKIVDVEGMTEVNGESYIVANVATNTFELTSVNGGANINSSSYTTYVSGGEVRKFVSTVSGLSHLEGQVVTVCADGAPQPNKTVSSGAITLSTSATVVHVGFGYNSDAQMLRLEAGAADGTALGKTRRIHRVGILIHRSLGLQIGTSLDELDTLTFRTSTDPLTRAPALYTGIISETIQSDHDFENKIAWRQSQPLPCTVLAVMPQMKTEDRG